MLAQAILCPAGDTWQCLEMCLVVITGGGEGCYRHAQGRGQGCCSAPCHAQGSPQTKADPAPDVNRTEAERQPCSGERPSRAKNKTLVPQKHLDYLPFCVLLKKQIFSKGKRYVLPARANQAGPTWGEGHACSRGASADPRPVVCELQAPYLSVLVHITVPSPKHI